MNAQINESGIIGDPSNDVIIAATAAAAGRTVVSADRRAFDGLPGIIAIDHRPA